MSVIMLDKVETKLWFIEQMGRSPGKRGGA